MVSQSRSSRARHTETPGGTVAKCQVSEFHLTPHYMFFLELVVLSQPAVPSRLLLPEAPMHPLSGRIAKTWGCSFPGFKLSADYWDDFTFVCQWRMPKLHSVCPSGFVLRTRAKGPAGLRLVGFFRSFSWKCVPGCPVILALHVKMQWITLPAW